MTGYRIEIAEELSSDWSSWFDGWILEIDQNQHTVLKSDVKDQAALHGILTKIRDLKLTLISVQTDDLDGQE